MFRSNLLERAFVGPFLVFLLGLVVAQGVAAAGEGLAAWPLAHPGYWIYPLQTFACACLLWHWWPHYRIAPPQRAWMGLAAGMLAFFVWMAPEWWFHQPFRAEGFDPTFFAGRERWLTVSLRFLRLVAIVPLVEELFWRGFLYRYIIDRHFERVPFGAWDWRAFAITTVGFGLEHQPADWPAALVTGALFNFVAGRSRSLSNCVLAHALANLLLGWQIMRTHEWGLW